MLVGLAHYRAMPSPLRGATLGFLDDLYVDPAARLAEITADDNYRARTLYDRITAKTGWNMYEMAAG